MAKKGDTSMTTGPERNQATPAATPTASSTPSGGDKPPTKSTAVVAIGSQRALEDAVEAERQLLMQANSVLKCLSEVLLYAHHPDAATHAEAARIVVNLIDQSVARLGSSKLRPLIEAVKGSREPEPRSEGLKLGLDDDNSVREPRLVYWWH